MEESDKDRVGRYRSACAEGEWGHAWLIAESIEQDELRIALLDGWWRTMDIPKLATQITWHRRDKDDDMFPAPEPLDLTRHNNWVIMIGDAIFSSYWSSPFDARDHQAAWASVPAEEVTPIWNRWAEDNSPEDARWIDIAMRDLKAECVSEALAPAAWERFCDIHHSVYIRLEQRWRYSRKNRQGEAAELALTSMVCAAAGIANGFGAEVRAGAWDKRSLAIGATESARLAMTKSRDYFGGSSEESIKMELDAYVRHGNRYNSMWTEHVLGEHVKIRKNPDIYRKKDG